MVVALVASGCVVKTNSEWVRSAASRDLACPEGQLVIHHYTNQPHRKGATGCGKSAMYNEVCQGGTCHWVRDLNGTVPPDK